MKLHSRDKKVLWVFAIFYISFGALITLHQEAVIYQPNEQNFVECQAFAGAKKVTHHGTRLYTKDTDRPTIVLYHGNAGSACDRAFYAELIHSAGYGYIVVEYTGYSNDTVSPTHETIKQDVRNVLEYLAETQISPRAVIGESIGTGVASYHALLQPPEKLLLISPFTSLADVARDRFWFYPTRFLVDNAFDSVTNLNPYRGFVTIIHGTGDTLIPYRLGESLFTSLQTEKVLIGITGAGHNDLFSYPETYTAFLDFLQ